MKLMSHYVSFMKKTHNFVLYRNIPQLTIIHSWGVEHTGID